MASSSMQHEGVTSSFAVAALCACVGLALLSSGCRPEPVANDSPTNVRRTSSMERAQRRAFDGAPPVIPHQRLGSSCVECHTETGKAVPERGFAPANPHLRTDGLSQTANCVQCHLFSHTEATFADNDFEGFAQDLRRGRRLYPNAPPVIPHPVFMRENCVACHSGPSARPEIRCDHAERQNCRQCHVPHQDDSSWPELEVAAASENAQ